MVENCPSKNDSPRKRLIFKYKLTTLDRERKIKFVQEQIGINNNGELTGELIVELEEKLKKMPILQGDVPSLSPSSMIAFGGKPPPIWLPDPEFGLGIFFIKNYRFQNQIRD